jgi:hypothetical protein
MAGSKTLLGEVPDVGVMQFTLFTWKVVTHMLPTPPPPLSIGIIGLGGNSRKIFEFKGLIAKIFINQ